MSMARASFEIHVSIGIDRPVFDGIKGEAHLTALGLQFGQGGFTISVEVPVLQEMGVAIALLLGHQRSGGTKADTSVLHIGFY